MRTHSLILLILLFWGAAVAKGQDVLGKWNWEDKGTFFTIDVLSVADTIFGNYCIVAHNGQRIECHSDSEEDCVWEGILDDMKINLTFQSCYTGAIGTAVLSFDPNSANLHWELQEVIGESFLPQTATLTRYH